MGITDWKLQCEPNINDNKLEEEEVIAAKLQNMQLFQQLGVKTEWKDEDYIVSNSPDPGEMNTVSLTGAPMPGGQPGMPPGGMQPQMGGAGGGGGGDEAMAMPIPQPAPPPEVDEEQFMDVDASNFFADAALGKQPKQKKGKQVRTELSDLMDELFYPERTVEEKKLKADEQAQQQQAQMGGMGAPAGAPPMGGMDGGGPPQGGGMLN
jgi:hypothetical protein